MSGLANFFCKGQSSKYFSLCVSYISVVTTKLCHCSIKAAVDNKRVNRHDCVPIKLYLKKKKQIEGQIWPMGYSLLIAGLYNKPYWSTKKATKTNEWG